MPIPHVTTDGTVHLDLSERVTRESKERQMKAADAYMRAFARNRISGGTYDEASLCGRREFEKTWHEGAWS